MKLISIPKVLREKLGEDGADALLDLINAAGEDIKNDVIKLSEEKFEKRLTEEISKLRVEMSKMYANLIKWMFIFWVGQIGVITAILFAFLKFMR